MNQFKVAMLCSVVEGRAEIYIPSSYLSSELLDEAHGNVNVPVLTRDEERLVRGIVLFNQLSSVAHRASTNVAALYMYCCVGGHIGLRASL